MPVSIFFVFAILFCLLSPRSDQSPTNLSSPMSCYLKENRRRSEARKVAIALNNSSTMLVRRQHSACAIESFRDAIQAMKTAVSTANTEQDDEELSRILKRASRSEIIVKALADKSSESSSATPRSPLMEVIFSRASLATIFSLLSATPRSTWILLPLSMEMESESRSSEGGSIMGNNDDETIDLESGMLMRNFGIAHAGAAHAAVEPILKTSILRKSYQCFRLAKVILHKIHENDTSAKTSENVLLLELLLEYDLLHVSVQLGMESRIMEHNENLLRIIAWIHAQDDLTNERTSSQLPFAAAA